MALSKKSRADQYVDILEFKEVVVQIQQTYATSTRAGYVAKLLSLEGLIIHYECGNPKRRVLAEFKKFNHDHEKKTACKMAEHGTTFSLCPKASFLT
jgi:hypothetical protein